ncbi:MAG: hypothetical protein QG622_748 [Actinomycetota bacterium]|nr:hypothetical protein [Actinomycetota bacterium]
MAQGPGRDMREDLLSRIDTTVPHSARRYDYLLGGKNNFAADRASAALLEEAIPSMRLGVQENRAFLRRTVDYMARAGVRQFLDIGSGLPTSPNVHEVAQAVDPSCRVVYVDNDPIVLVHARALLTSSPEGETAYLDADFRRPEGILTDSQFTDTIDLTRPLGLIVVGVLQYFLDEDDPYDLVSRLVAPLVPGSHITLTNGTYDFHPVEQAPMVDEIMRSSGLPMRARSKDEFTRFFDGLELIEPGVSVISKWRDENEPTPRPDPADVNSYGAIGVKKG